MSMKLTDSICSRFLSKFETDDECWIWNGALNTSGYGVMRINRKTVLATHVSLAYYKSEYKEFDYQCALHSCDNPRCVNPFHLRWGSQKENAKDRIDRNRQTRFFGESNGRSKLTIDNVKDIKEAAQDGVKIKILAERYSVNASTIYRILSRELWSEA